MPKNTNIEKLYNNAEALFAVWDASGSDEHWNEYQKAKDAYLIAVFGDLETAYEAENQ